VLWIAGSECARVGLALEMRNGGDVGRKSSSCTSRLNRSCLPDTTAPVEEEPLSQQLICIFTLRLTFMFRRLGWLADLGKEARRRSWLRKWYLVGAGKIGMSRDAPLEVGEMGSDREPSEWWFRAEAVDPSILSAERARTLDKTS